MICLHRLLPHQPHNLVQRLVIFTCLRYYDIEKLDIFIQIYLQIGQVVMPELEIKLPPLFPFKRKPILVGTMAKYFYGISCPTDTLDLVIDPDDFQRLQGCYPDKVRWLGLDQVVVIDNIRLRRTIEIFDYDTICENMIEKSGFAIISIDRLYFLTVVDTSNVSRSSELEKLNSCMASLKLAVV